MRIQILYILIVSFFTCSFSCTDKTEKARIGYNNMNNTIEFRAEIEFVRGKSIQNGDIVLLKNYNDDTTDWSYKCYRVMARPGDNIRLDSNRVYINEIEQEPALSSISSNRVILKGQRPDYLTKLEVRLDDSTSVYEMTYQDYLKTKAHPNVKSVMPYVQSPTLSHKKDDVSVFFDGARQGYLISQTIPKEGKRLMEDYLLPFIGQNNTKGTVVQTSYYFLMNDNFFEMPDSRTFGLVPVDSIVGVVTKIYKSKAKAYKTDDDDSDIQIIRWED